MQEIQKEKKGVIEATKTNNTNTNELKRNEIKPNSRENNQKTKQSS